MAPDPRLCPGGIAELAATVAALHAAGIGTILDVVFNHTGESDALRPDAVACAASTTAAYFRHAAGRPPGQRHRHRQHAGLRPPRHPPPHPRRPAPLRRPRRRRRLPLRPRPDPRPQRRRLRSPTPRSSPRSPPIRSSPTACMIAEPWDIGPGGYQLGSFPAAWLEWNDRFRDDVRRFWRGDAHMLGALATAPRRLVRRLRASPPPAAVNFIAAHDGFTARRPRRLPPQAQRGQRRGAIATATTRTSPGTTASKARPTTPRSSRRARRDVRALLATLFASRGTIMLTAGDEFGRSQGGNNNAYAQDNPTHLARLGRPRPRPRGLHRRPRRLPPRPSRPRRPDASSPARPAPTASPTSPGSPPAASPRPRPTGAPPAARR